MYWLVVAWALLGLAPWWIGAAYAIGFLTPLAAGCGAALLLPAENAPVYLSQLFRGKARVARIAGLTILCVAAAAFMIARVEA